MSAVRVAAKIQPAEQAMIIFHGLGDSGSGWSFLAEYLQKDPAFAHTRFIFPHAPILSVTANGGMKMPAWFDIMEWSLTPSKVDTEGFLRSLGVAQIYVQEQIDAGIRPENIIVGGFSQGAALALASAVTLPVKIGGFVSLSGFCTITEKLRQIKNQKNVETPVFHGHGDCDPVISLYKGQEAKNFFTSECGIRHYDFRIYPGLEHSTAPEEMIDLVQFIKNIFKLHKN